MTGVYIREHEDLMKEVKLLWVLDLGIYDKDFLRQLISYRSDEEIDLWQTEILCQQVHIQWRMIEKEDNKYQKLFIVPGDTLNVLTNTITYLKYCRIRNKKLKDTLPVYEKYLEHRDEWNKIDGLVQYHKPEVIKLTKEVK